ncbi:50S ribosomal protein L17 [Candidatus Woesebacteria bacterium]|nr:50S ribosomal protein L17 [Candidatus Woesebacteria bacterium]
MKHVRKTIRFSDGYDADRMMVKKMMRNFLLNAHLTTTEARAKAVKSVMEKILTKTKEVNEANKNYIARYIPNTKMIATLFDQVGPALKDIPGGYLRIVRLNERAGDKAMMVRLEWAHPVVIDWQTKKSVKKAASKESTKTPQAPKQTEKKIVKATSAKKSTEEKVKKPVTKAKKKKA